jgi:hypothetical protein
MPRNNYLDPKASPLHETESSPLRRLPRGRSSLYDGASLCSPMRVFCCCWESS